MNNPINTSFNTFPKTLVTLALMASLISLLTSCTHFKPTSGELDAVHQLNQWSVNGKLGIQAPDHQSGSGIVSYTQKGDEYHFRFIGPIGQGRVEIIRSEDSVTLILPEGRHQDTDANALIKRHLSWDLPVKHFQYWIRGIPNPSAPFEWQTSSPNSDLTFKQDGWLITLSNYGVVDQYPMPHKIFLQQILQEEGWRFTLVVKRWTLK